MIAPRNPPQDQRDPSDGMEFEEWKIAPVPPGAPSGMPHEKPLRDGSPSDDPPLPGDGPGEDWIPFVDELDDDERS